MRYPVAVTALALPAVLASPGFGQSNWIDFTDESAARLQADPLIQHYDLISLGAIGGPCEGELDMIDGDFDQDGDTDVVIVGKAPAYDIGARTPVLLLNDAGVLTDHTFFLASDFLVNPRHSRDVCACDVNGDGWLDLVVANTFGQDPDLYLNQGDAGGSWGGFRRKALWFRTEQNFFTFLADLPPPNYDSGMATCAVAAGDVDGDADVDLFLANYQWSVGSLRYHWQDRLLINMGSGVFLEKTSSRLTGNQTAGSTGADMADADGDLDLDIFLTNAAAGPKILYNDGSGSFLLEGTVPGGQNHYMHAVVNYDNDNLPDFYGVGDLEDRTTVNLGGSPTVSWSPKQDVDSRQTDGWGGNTRVYDLDGNGDEDVLIADLDTFSFDRGWSDTDGNVLTLLRNSYVNNNLPAMEHPDEDNLQPVNIDGTWDFVALHLNGDSKLDLLIGHTGGLSVFTQQ